MGHSLEFMPFFIDCDLDNDLLQQTECRSDAEPVPWLLFRGLAASASSSWNICFMEPWAPHSLPGWRDHLEKPGEEALRLYGEGVRSSCLSVLVKPLLLADFNFMKDFKRDQQKNHATEPSNPQKSETISACCLCPYVLGSWLCSIINKLCHIC